MRAGLGSVGKGSFRQTGPKPVSERSEAVLSERATCLVIDDHPLVRIGVRGVLGERFEVHESSSREEGVDLVRDIGDFDVAIVDMRWRRNGAGPSISGAET